MNPAVQPDLVLRDIHLPSAPSWWPPAPGWWLVAVVLLALASWGALVVWRRYRIQGQRQRVLDALATLEDAFDRDRSPQQLARISVLLRRLALMRFPRERVAVLTGGGWLGFLDETGGNGRFGDGPGRVLAAGPYQRALPQDLDVPGFTALVREWVQRNTGAVR